MEKKYILIGGGLANGLLALKFLQNGRDDFLLIEKDSRLGGEHTWSFHGSDISNENLAWLSPTLTQSWQKQSVQFKSYHRTLETSYHSIKSSQFNKYLLAQLPSHCLRLGCEVKSIDGPHVSMADETLTAELIFDSRPPQIGEQGPCGYQKFFGLEIKTKKPHGLDTPVIMDASVPQLEGYRFIYVLPWSKNTLLIEDTRYCEDATIDESEMKQQVLDYCLTRFGEVEEVLYQEQASLPIPLVKNKVIRLSPSSPHCLDIGLRGGYFHPVTGYSVPFALQMASIAANNANLPSAVKMAIDQLFCDWFQQSSFYFMLNKMLFKAALPHQRVQIFERFYKLPKPLIERFYRGESHLMDKIRVLVGKPPVPIFNAVKSLLNRNYE